MYRNFYNLLASGSYSTRLVEPTPRRESQCFLRPFSCWAVWNDGIMEFWKTGYEKRKKIYSTKSVVSTSYDDAHQTSIFCFHPENTPILRENQYNYTRFDSLNPPFQCSLGAVRSASRRPEPMISSFHCSIIPIAVAELSSIYRRRALLSQIFDFLKAIKASI